MDGSQSMCILAASIQAKLTALDTNKQRRRLQELETVSRLDLTHNDYLGLRDDLDFQQRTRLAAARWPVGAGASRLLGGEHSIYSKLETQFAAWTGAASALYFSSGYAANEALMAALLHDDTAFFSDAYNHASLIDGMRLARLTPAQKHIFPHNDMQQLAAMLQASSARLKIVVTESLFSMDGDFCPAPALHALCQQYQALLVVDEAHSVGVYGPAGRGWLAAHGLDPQSYIAVYPCGKAMAGSGAFICGPLWFRDYLINTARNFIYSTGPSPWVAAALCESILTVSAAEASRNLLQNLAQQMRQGLREIGFHIGASTSHIVPVILGQESIALAAEAFCRQRGLAVRAIRPPTVPADSCRLRLSLHAALSPSNVSEMLNIFKELHDAISSDLRHRHRH